MAELFILIHKKKAQVWSMDAIVAMIIFMVAMFLLFFYAMNYTNESEINIEDLSYQGNIAAELILSEDNGFLINNEIDQLKLESFYYVDYEIKKKELGIKDNFFFTIPDLEIEGVPVAYVGLINPENAGDIIQISRFTIYNNKPVQFNLFIWRE